jgi:DNA-binding CsgD family transcriptional regulator
MISDLWSMNFLLNKVIFSNRINALDRSVQRVTKMLLLIVFIILAHPCVAGNSVDLRGGSLEQVLDSTLRVDQREFDGDYLRREFGLTNYDTLLNLNKYAVKDFIGSLVTRAREKHIPAKKLNEFFDELLIFAQQKGDQDLYFIIELIKISENLESLEKEALEQRSRELLNKSIKSGRNWHIAQSKKILGFYLLVDSSGFEGLLLLFEALRLLEGHDADSQSLYQIYYQLGIYSYKFEQYRLAKGYFQQALTTGFASKKPDVYNSIGLSYRGEGILDSANYYFNIALNNAQILQDTVYSIVIGGNIGESLYRSGNFKEATPLLKADAEMCIALNSFGNASNALVYLSDIYLQEGAISQAEETMWEAYAYAKKSAELRRMRPVYQQLTNWYASQGDAKKTKLYADSAQYVFAEIRKDFGQLTGLEADKIEAITTKNLALSKSEEAKESAQFQFRTALLIGVLILAVLFLLFMQFRARKRLNEDQMTLKNAQLINELNEATLKLHAYVQESRSDNLSEKVILTDANWREFLELFDEVHPNFVPNLKEAYPVLSMSELRLCCLSYMRLSDKEMSSMLGVGINSIRVTRNRLRKKLAIGIDQDIQALLRNF